MKSSTYFLAFILPITTVIALSFQDVWSYATLVLAFGIIPTLELFAAPNLTSNKDSKKKNTISEGLYDYLLYLMVPVHSLILIWFLNEIGSPELLTYEMVGLTLSMGVQCGAIGINVAHELGHRKSSFERFLARTLLLSSLYMHFIVEHNRGHHKHVATPKDPASARMNESIYAFWPRTLIGSFISAWNIAKNEQLKRGKQLLTWDNEMVQVVIIQATLCLLIFFLFGWNVLFPFLIAAFIGMLLLETVNYIEHYGLKRKQLENGRYERVQAWHSWNSDYPVGRIMLFELTRHSDHHYKASKKYQHLEHLKESPQLPTGYPGMMLLSLLPPLWFKIVNPLAEKANR